MGYRIKSVAEMIGVPRNTLLAWERRYGVVRPARQANGYREYSEADVNRLRALKKLLDRGHRLSEAISFLENQDQTEPSTTGVREQVLEALLRLDREAAAALIRRGVSLSYTRQLDELYFPMLREVGDRWSAGKLSIAQEHFVSHFCREQLTAMLLSLSHGPPNGPKALCAVYPEDPHDLPLLGLAVRLALSGHRILFLGAQTPVDALLEMIQSQQPEKVCISVIMPAQPSALIMFARSLTAVAKGSILFGGAGLPVTGLPKLERVTWKHST